jgi:hypothetical protein
MVSKFERSQIIFVYKWQILFVKNPKDFWTQLLELKKFIKVAG